MRVRYARGKVVRWMVGVRGYAMDVGCSDTEHETGRGRWCEVWARARRAELFKSNTRVYKSVKLLLKPRRRNDGACEITVVLRELRARQQIPYSSLPTNRPLRVHPVTISQDNPREAIPSES